MSNAKLIAAGLAAASLLGLVRPTLAADLDAGYGDAPPPVAEEKVEFGSGWYIRGDAGAVKLPSMQISPPSTLPSPASPFAIPSAPIETVTNGHRIGYDASLGGGYKFNNWFRTDLIVDFHQPIRSTVQTAPQAVFCPTGVTYPNEVTNADGSISWGEPSYANGGCTGTYVATLRSYDALVNGYIDLGNLDRVTPYLGAGIGVSFGHYNGTATYVQANNVPYNVTYTDPKFNATYSQNFNRSSGASYQTLAWALMAGFAFDVFDNTKIDVGYRYLNLGTIPGVSGTLAAHEVRAGIRYMVDN